MKALKLLVPVLCAVAGLIVGMLLRSDPYLYRNEPNGTYRIDRATGVEQVASSSGWLPQVQPLNSGATASR